MIKNKCFLTCALRLVAATYTILLLGTCDLHAQIKHIEYPWPNRSYGQADITEYSDRWFLNSSKISRPLDVEYGNFNYHLEGGNSTFRNIPTMSYGICFPFAIGEKYQRDEIIKFTDFLNSKRDFNNIRTTYKGYELSALASYDMLGWKFVSFSATYGFSFGQRKLTSIIDNRKRKLRNPFFGLLAGTDLRFNLFRNSGLSVGGFCHYMLDVSKPKWINRDQYPYDLPETGKFTGWQWGVGLSYSFYDEA